MKVLGQQITQLPRSPQEIDLAIVAAGAAGIGALLFMVGADVGRNPASGSTQRAVEKGLAWAAGGLFVLAGVGAAAKICLAQQTPAPGTTASVTPAQQLSPTGG